MNQATIRVAAAQLETGTDLDVNLATCLAAIDVAADRDARLVVLPEFCNHLSWYDDPAHCWRVSVELDGAWLREIARRAHARRLYVVINATVRRDGGTCTGTSLLLGPDGACLGTADKQVLIGHENDLLRPATAVSPIIDTAIGRIGLYACMDGVIHETPRSLALRGAELLCNSLNSFAIDEASLHVPVRAAENRVFVVAANKVGPLIPAALLAPVSAATSIPERFLAGAGESQIVDPTGAVLARAPRQGAAVIVADIAPARARDKRRADGSDVFASRWPSRYAALAADPATAAGASLPVGAVDGTLEVAALALAFDDARAVPEAVARIRELVATGVELLVLPELFCVPGGRLAAPLDATAARQQLDAVIAALAPALGAAHVVTSLPWSPDPTAAPRLCGVVIGASGMVAAVPHLHPSARHGWSAAGAEGALATVELPWGRLGLLVGDDALYPEASRLLAIAGVSVIAAPVDLQEPWEATLGLIERSAENRVHVVAATRPGAAGTSLCTRLPDDFTLMTPWQTRTFDGVLSCPDVVRAPAGPGVARAVIRPAAAHNKVVSHRTDLLAGRPWRLAGALTRTESSHDA